MNIRTKLAALGAASLASLNALAVGVAQADVVALVDDANATFDYIVPIGLGILGLFVAVSIGLKTWRKLT